MLVQEGNSGKSDKLILTGMIVNNEVCGRIAAKWEKKGLFQSEWANRIGGWCVKYYAKYGKAPNNHIETLFAEWAETNSDKATTKLTEDFLGHLALDYAKQRKQLNPSYVIDVAGKHFNKVRLERLAEDLVADEDKEDGWKHINNIYPIDLGSGSQVDAIRDREGVKALFEEKNEEILVDYNGALGKFFGKTFSRDNLVAFMGPEKRGKTFFLIDVAWRAMLQRRKVAFFEVGDLSERQLRRRFITRAIGRPIEATGSDYPVKFPIKIFKGKKNRIEVEHEERKYKDKVSWKEVRNKMDKIERDIIRDDDPYFYLSVSPNSSISVNGIKDVLSGWKRRHDYVPDVIVIDYADILAAPPGFHGEHRDSINETWKAMRRLSQELHCLIVTATQSNAASYSEDILSMKNFSEDKRKFAHVTAMYGINQSEDEREQGLIRLNPLVVREENYYTRATCYVATCLPISNPCVRSYLPNNRFRIGKKT